MPEQSATDDPPESVRASSRLREFFAVPFRGQTYKNLLYLGLAFPLGIVYVVGLVLGMAVGIGLLVTWVGLPILIVTVAAATSVATFEAVLAHRLGSVEVSVPPSIAEFDASDRVAFPGDGFVDAIEDLGTAHATRTSIHLVLSKFGFGLLSVIGLTVSSTVTVAFSAAPVIYETPNVFIGGGVLGTEGQYTVGPWVVDSLPEALAASGAGVVFLFVALNLLNALAQVHARYVRSVLHVDEPSG